MDRDYWDSIADRFDDEVLKILERDRNGILKQTIGRLASHNRTAADLGCGNGSLLPLLATGYGTVLAVDLSSRLLASAESRHTTHNNIDYVQADLSKPFTPPRKADTVYCINVLLHPRPEIRQRVLHNAVASMKSRGRLVLVVPAFESLLHTYHTIVETNVALGVDREVAAAEVRAVYEDEVISAVDGVVELGTEPTKMHTREEVELSLRNAGLSGVETYRIEYDWVEMIDDAPANLADPYPWDWMFVARK